MSTEPPSFEVLQNLHSQLTVQDAELEHLKNVLSQKEHQIKQEQANVKDLLFKLGRFYNAFEALNFSTPDINAPWARFLTEADIRQLVTKIAETDRSSTRESESQELARVQNARDALAYYLTLLLGAESLMICNFNTPKPELFMRIRHERTDRFLDFSLRIEHDDVVYHPIAVNIDLRRAASFLAKRNQESHLVRENLHFWTPRMMGAVFGWKTNVYEHEKKVPIVKGSRTRIAIV